MSDFEDLAYPPEGGPSKKWFMGYVVPLCVVGYVVYAVRQGEIIVPSKNAKSATGPTLPFVAIGYISTAFFMHFHWGWGLSLRLWHLSHYGKIASLVLLLISALMFLYLSLSAF
jgi:hypothetical protein